MLPRSTGWPGAGTAEDTAGKDGTGATVLLLRSNKATNETTSAIVEMPMATHGTIVCAFRGAFTTGDVKDVPHSGHPADPGLTVVPQEGQVDTTGVPQRPQNFPATEWPHWRHWTDLAFTIGLYHVATRSREPQRDVGRKQSRERNGPD